MKELMQILAAVDAVRGAGRPAALATVVRVEGSAYRRPGARMLIRGDGTSVGGVSGGCLERDVILRAGAVIESATPCVVRYDTAPDVSGPAYSVGCGGMTDVLIEPLHTPAGERLTRFLQEVQNRTRPSALATVISSRSPVVRLGEHFLLEDESGSLDRLPHLSIDMLDALRQGQSSTACYEIAGQGVELFIEVIAPRAQLVVFGAGPDAHPLASMARGLGWYVTVVDLRSAAATLAPPPDADALVRASPQEIASRLVISESAAAVIMTHNYGHDRALLRWLAESPPAYLGILGARHRTQRLLEELAAEGIRPDAEALARLHYPVGLDLGAETPEEIALSVVGEILAAQRARPATSLADRPGPIHALAEPAVLRPTFLTEPLACPATE